MAANPARPRVAVAWSSGKDAAMALHRLRLAGEVEVVSLLTTISAPTERVAMHGTRRALVEAQAAAAGLPLVVAPIPDPCPNDAYDAAMAAALAALRAEGVTRVAFGDLFLADIRAYRESRLAGTGVAPLFPLWGEETGALARAMLAAGIEAVVASVDTDRLDAGFAGRDFDAAFLAALPAGIDPCGENGEFHSFVHAGPMFGRPVALRRGAVAARGPFAYAELELAG
jgi:uncharacterized protein (TIGR00290 family)